MRPHKPSAQARAIAFLVLVCLSLVGMETWSIWKARQVQIQEATTATANMTRSLAQHAHDTMRAADTVLLGLVERVEHDGADAPALARLHGLLQARAAQLALINGILIYDETGRWIATSLAALPPNVNNADREYFQYHKANTNRGSHIGLPVKSRSTGHWIIPMSRRINHADGSFAGVALTTIEMAYFTRFHDSFDIGKSGSIFLALENGTLLARRPFEASTVGKNIRQGPVFTQLRSRGPGTAMLTSQLDGVERLYSYRRVEDYPLVVATALSKQDLLADWRQASLRSAGAIALLVFGLGIVGVRLVRQIRVREAVERQLQRSDERLRLITDNLPVLIAYVDPQHRFQFGNATFKQWLGLDPTELVGMTMADAIGEESYRQRVDYLDRAFGGETVHFEMSSAALGIERVLQTVYVPHAGADGSVDGLYTISTDVTALKQKEQELTILARSDTLTGLPNRRQFDDRLEQAIARCGRAEHAMALMFLDIDHFKQINDSIGHAGGDAVLRQFAQRLTGSVRKTDLVARLAGDEFVIIIDAFKQPDELGLIAQKILASIRLPMSIDGNVLQVTASIGVTVFNQHDMLTQPVMARADQALYEAKKAGRDCCCEWQPPARAKLA